MTRAPRPITVRRPDPETGELTETVVGPDHFKPPAPRMPELDEERLTRPRTGRSVLYMHEHRELVIAYWLAHERRLTKRECVDIVHRNATTVTRPPEFEPGWQPGEELAVANNVTAQIKVIEESMQGFRTKLLVRDFRPVFVKRAPSASSPPEVDDQGYPVPPGPGDIDAARIDGAYTTSQALAVPDTGEEIGDDLHRRLNEEAALKNRMSRHRGRRQVTVARLEQRLAEARAKHQRSTARSIERQLKKRRGGDA